MDHHPNVLRLRVDASPLQQFIHCVVSFVPSLVRSYVKTIFPEWFLPENIVLKTERVGKEEEHGDPDELMDTEIRAYKQLKPVQGVVVPVYYGEVQYNGARSIIIQDVGGASFTEPAGMLLEFDEFARLLEECYVALISFGVNLEDAQLGNFILVDGRAMAVDLEMVSFDRTPDEMRKFMYMDVTGLARQYRDHRKFLRSEGWLEAAT
ncbi:hypothetical protein ACHAPT_000677 [Fusarium lateritium]